MSSKRAILDELVKHFAGGKKAQFARMLGIAPQSLNTWYVNNYLDIEKVYSVCPGVSADWLLTGDGEMMLTNRTPETDYVIPYVNEKSLLSGEWSNNSSYIVAKNVPIKSSFLTSMPSDTLGDCIYPQSLLFCNIVDLKDLQCGCLYIVNVSFATLFVEFKSKNGKPGNLLYHFTTRRSVPLDNEFSISEHDIIKCAEIEMYTRNSYAQDVI